MSAHTPGPWVYDSGYFYAACQLDECGLTRRLNGPWIDYEKPIAEMGDGRPENYKANARLIAAAPDLLDTLRELVEIVHAAISAGDWKVDGCCDPSLSLDWARAAIAKAEGRA